MVSWFMTPRSDTVGSKRFRGYNSPWRWRLHDAPKRWYPTISLHCDVKLHRFENLRSLKQIPWWFGILWLINFTTKWAISLIILIHTSGLLLRGSF